MDAETLDILKQAPPEMFVCSAIMSLILWGGFWAVFAWFFQKNLAAIPEPHRLMRPGQVWWLVPFPVALVFLFFVVARISDSWKSFFDSRGEADSVGGCGRKTGLASAVLAIASNLLSVQPFLGGGTVITVISQIGALVLGLVGFILLIVYAIQINDLKLKSLGEGDNPIDQ